MSISYSATLIYFFKGNKEAFIFENLLSKEINQITGPTSESAHVITNKNRINDQKENLIQGFDGYEQFLYFTSGTYAWPKQNNLKPYTLYSISSSEAKTWIGSEDSILSSSYYGGQLLSASLFDRQNTYNLNQVIPSHIVEDGPMRYCL